MQDRRGSTLNPHCLSEYIALCLLEGMRVEEAAAGAGGEKKSNSYRWLYLASIFVVSILNHLASFNAIITAFVNQLSQLPYRAGRDELIWVILQYVSGMGKSGLPVSSSFPYRLPSR